MRLFNNPKTGKSPSKYAGMLLRQMYPVIETTPLEELKLHIKDLKKCLKSFFPLSKYHTNITTDLLEERFIHHSNAIENNSISKEGVRLILREGQVVPNFSLREHLEIVNHKEGLDYVKECIENDTSLSRDALLYTHFLILKTIDTKHAGIFRETDNKVFSSEYESPTPEQIEAEIYKYFQFYNSNRNNEAMDQIDFASDMHTKLCLIRPFTDGNGIVARLFMNYILMKDGYPIINISGNRENRLKYFNALEASHTNTEAFRKFTAMCVFKTLAYYIKNLVPLAPKHKGAYFYDQMTKKCGIDERERLISLIKAEQDF